jgi:uncharacterized Zn finger protein
MNQIPTRQTSPIDIDKTTEVKCDSCSNPVFNQGVFLRKVSALLNPDGRDGYLPIPTFYCTSCGAVNDEFVPPELKSKIKLT